MICDDDKKSGYQYFHYDFKSTDGKIRTLDFASSLDLGQKIRSKNLPTTGDGIVKK